MRRPDYFPQSQPHPCQLPSGHTGVHRIFAVYEGIKEETHTQNMISLLTKGVSLVTFHRRNDQNYSAQESFLNVMRLSGTG